MSTLAIAALRARAVLPTFLSLALIVVVAVVALGATAGVIQHGVAAGARATLANAAAQSAAVRVTTHLADDSATQDAAATDLFDQLLPDGTVTVTHTQRSLAVPVLAGGTATTDSTAVFALVPDLADRVEVTDGAWPAGTSTGAAVGARPVAVQADAAAALGLAVGDELTVGTKATSVAFQVAALWRATDPTAPVWFADSAATAGRSGGASGLFVVEEGLTALPTQHFAVWTLSATPSAADDQTRAAVIVGLHRLNDALDATPNITESSSSIEGTLAGTLQRIDSAGRGATAIGISAAFIVGMLGIVALLQVSTVLVGSRREHSALLRARGLARSQNALLAISEGLLVAIPAGLVGLAGTGVILGLVTGAEPLSAAMAASPFALGVSLVSVALLTVTVLSESPGTAANGRHPLANFVISFGTIGAAAALSTWQLHAQGSPVPAGATGGADVVSATSPALVLITIAALGTMMFIVLAPLLAARASRRGTVVALLADGQLGARATRYLVPILALAISIACAAFATGIATTWQSAQVQAQLVGTGASVGIALRSDGTGPADTEPVTAARFAAMDGVDGASAALVTRARLGADSVPFVSLRPDVADALLGAAGGELAEALRTTSPAGTGLELPATATGVAATVSFGDTRPVATFAVSIWASDADGSLARILLAAEPVAGSGTAGTAARYVGALPDGIAPWRLLAVEAERRGTPDRAVRTLTVGELASTADGAITALDDAEVSLDIAAVLPRSRAPIAASGVPGRLPVLLTTALADRVNLAVGDPLDIGFGASGSTLDAQVSAIIETLPGAGSRFGVGTDLAALNDATLQQGRTPVLADNVWIDTADPDAVSANATTVAASTAVIFSQRTTSSAPMLQPAMNAFWIAAAAAGLLALITLAAFIADDARSRRSSIPVLRALGLSTAQQARARARELLIILGFAVGVGVIAGLGVTLVAVTPFVVAAIPSADVSVAPALDPLPWLWYSVSLLAAALFVIGVSLWRLRRVTPGVRS